VLDIYDEGNCGRHDGCATVLHRGVRLLSRLTWSVVKIDPGATVE
jgi:hypothetical protein